MTFADDLRESGRSSHSVLHEFLLSYRADSQSVHAFFEGEDDPSFYSGFIRDRCLVECGLYFYDCGGKRKVYEVRRLIVGRNLKGIFLLFFVDKDLDNLIANDFEFASDLYVTDYYSLENHLVTEEMLSRLWHEVLHFKNVAVELEKVIDKFCMELDRFHLLILPIMSWILYMRRIGERLNLKNARLEQLFHFDDDLTVRYLDGPDLIARMEEMCGARTPPDFANAREGIHRELSGLHPKSYVRGKFELWFFVTFLKQLGKVLREQVLDRNQKLSIKIMIEHNNAVEVLGPRARIPVSLDVFLRANLAGT